MRHDPDLPNDDETDRPKRRADSAPRGLLLAVALGLLLWGAIVLGLRILA